MEEENIQNQIEPIWEKENSNLNNDNNYFQDFKNNINKFLNKLKRLVIYSVLAFFLFILFLYIFIFRIPNNFPKNIVFSVQERTTLQMLSKDLKDKNIISSRVGFEVFMILYNGEKHIIPGDYLLPNQEFGFSIARRISSGEKHLAPVRVTIPEGFTNIEIANLFKTKLNKFNQSNFLKNAKEGYMFPDTYFFLTTDDDNVVLNKISENYERKIKDLKDDIVKSGKSEKDIIIMASIIEEEAKGDQDRAYISGILWNRIRIGMALQADASPITYKERGLPPSPIANPGLEAIKAAIYPQKSSYLFYLHDKQGNIHYAKNFAEHKKNVEKYLR